MSNSLTGTALQELPQHSSRLQSQTMTFLLPIMKQSLHQYSDLGSLLTHIGLVVDVGDGSSGRFQYKTSIKSIVTKSDLFRTLISL